MAALRPLDESICLRMSLCVHVHEPCSTEKQIKQDLWCPVMPCLWLRSLNYICYTVRHLAI